MGTNKYTCDTDLPARKANLRQALLVRRRNEPKQAQQQASELICKRLLKHLSNQPHCTLAGYFSVDGEVNIEPAMRALHDTGWTLAVPVVDSEQPGQMQFHRWNPTDALRRNRYGIPEPVKQQALDSQVSVMLVPLVAVDARGNRLGMGGGFYDRWLQRYTSPALQTIGIAYRYQRVDSLPLDHWDQPLGQVISDV